jgi:hypothetical protein
VSAAYDSVIGQKNDFGVTGLTTSSMTLPANTNRAVALGLYALANASSFTYSGSSGTPTFATIAGATNWVSGLRLQLFSVVALNSGAQTFTVNWTVGGATSASLSAMALSGVDQTTPANGGDTAALSFSTADVSKSCTSTSGDLTVSMMGDGSTDTTSTATGTGCTKRVTEWGSMDTGPGTGTTTHVWHNTVQSDRVVVVANFKASGGAVSVTYPQLERHTRGLGRGVSF